MEISLNFFPKNAFMPNESPNNFTSRNLRHQEKLLAFILISQQSGNPRLRTFRIIVDSELDM
jgi:hypothetical protein